jgi:hypothetical protein
MLLRSITQIPEWASSLMKRLPLSDSSCKPLSMGQRMAPSLASLFLALSLYPFGPSLVLPSL